MTNDEFVKLKFEPENLTHFGPIVLDVLQILPEIFIHLKATNKKQEYLNLEIDVCKPNFPINLMSTYLHQYIEKNYNLELFECPLKPGNYQLASARPRIDNPTGIIPSFIPMSGNLTITAKARTIIGGTIVQLGNSTETFEFY